MVYSRATTSAIAERWALPVFWVVDISVNMVRINATVWAFFEEQRGVDVLLKGGREVVD
jgi:hypothetical protein